MDIKHISDEHWGELLVPPEIDTQHLAECSACRKEHERLHAGLGALAQWADAAEKQPEIFWERQRLRIRARIAQEHLPRTIRFAWVAALAIIVLASLALRTGSRVPVQRAQVDPDQQLLVAVELTLDGYVPEALQPASVLADEMAEPGQGNSNPHDSKENPAHD